MSVSSADLAPYVTLLLARAVGPDNTGLVKALLRDVEQLVRELDDEATRRILGRAGPEMRDELITGFVHFSEKRRPPWLVADDGTLRDLTHHVVIVSQFRSFVGFCCTTGSYQESIVRAIRAQDPAYPALAQLITIEASLLNAAFVSGRARTLWLSGLHRPTAVKADAKILSGINLVDALSPLTDQSYTFSAVRCNLDSDAVLRAAIGVTPRKSRVWSGSTGSWAEFCEQVLGVLKRLANADATGQRTEAPLPFLAVPAGDAAAVSNAYDMLLVSPELLSDDPQLDATVRALAERCAYHTRFRVTGRLSPSFAADVELDGDYLGQLEFQIGLGADGRAHNTVLMSTASSDALKDVRDACKQNDWLTVYYDSGHTLAHGTVFQSQYRDLPFTAWEWSSFAGYNVDEEKPLRGKTVAFDQIGLAKSLFCWVHKQWSSRGTASMPAWLVCDDGANEVADFVHFATRATDRPLLSLIHVKGAHSKAAKRDLSTSAYEVVVGQAVKNLRALERRNLIELLERGSTNATKLFAWSGGSRLPDRSGLVQALENCGSNYDREVIIVQPSAQRSSYERLPAKAGPKPAWYFRKLQLDTLLSGAQADCFAMGAPLRVIADGS